MVSISSWSKDIFSCSICVDVLNSPVTTPCGHNFCRTCISTCWDGQVQYKCPVCSKLFQTRPDLQVNAFISEMVDQFRSSVQVKEQPCVEPAEVPCDVCTGTQLKAVKSCLVCFTSFCQTHLEPHQRVAGLKRHRLVEPMDRLEDRMCKKHDRLLELFCQTEQVCVCQFCKVTNHKSHPVVPLKEEYEVKTAQLGKMESEVQQMIQERQRKIQEIKDTVDRSKADADREIADGVQVLNALKRSIEKWQDEFNQTVKEKLKSTEKEAEDLIKELEQEIEDLTNRSSEGKQLSQTEDHLHFLQTFRSLKDPPSTSDWTTVEVRPPSYVGTWRRSLDQLEETLNMEMKKLCGAAELKRVQQYEVDVTLDPDTAYPSLILSEDGKQVHHGGVWKTLPDNPKRFIHKLNVLTRQSFSSGRFYFEVQVKDKTEWCLGVARESIGRNGGIKPIPKNGYWTILFNKDVLTFNGNPEVSLPLRAELQKVGVFVDYDEGLVSFYDVEARVHIYSATCCTFSEPLYSFLSPGIYDYKGKNSAPLIISPLEETLNIEMKKLRDDAELKRVQQYEVDVTLDPDTAHPHLILSEDGKQVHDGGVVKTLPDNPKRFTRYLCVLTRQSFSSGRFYFEVQVKDKTAWRLGVARESINRKGVINLTPKNGSWTIFLDNDGLVFSDDPDVRLPLRAELQKVGVFVDYDEGLVSFYDVEARVHIYSATGCTFTEPLYPFLSPCLYNYEGKNSAPLIISPLLNMDIKNLCAAELKRVQQYEVDMTLDPHTAHSWLILSEDGKQVHDGGADKKLPDNPKRFTQYIHVLTRQSFSSGRFYFEVQVNDKTEWRLGVARESINRKGWIMLTPENGYWTLYFNKDGLVFSDNPAVHLPLRAKLQKVGVFVDYDEGLVSFYDVEARVHIYSATGCTFSEPLYPFLCPGLYDYEGKNSAPLIISPVNQTD
ncbi:unnamed protein product [Lota lota]